MIFVNFKVYRQSTGENTLDLIKVLEGVADETQIKIIPVAQASDIKEIVSISKLEVWAQRTDHFEPGAHTGAILPEAVFEDGAIGTFLNHSENKFSSFDELKKANERALGVGLKTLVFSGTISELVKNAGLNPTFLAYEPPELVGSKDTSVTKEMPEIIADAVGVARNKGLPLVVGAGVKSQEDVRVSLSLGAVGVAVASDVVASRDPRSELMDLVKGFN